MPVNFLNLQQLDTNFRKGIVRDHFDEPTYLTFSLDFDLDIPMHNESNFLMSSPLFNRDGDASAINYLINRGFPGKANQLAVFNALLKYLRDSTPWYFQSVKGLEQMWAQGTNPGGYKAKDLILEVGTLEAVDLRIGELADIYRNTIYDKEFMRERVPDNLRWFSMDIWIAEFRNLRNVLPPLLTLGSEINVGLGSLGGLGGSGNALGNVLQNFGYIKFKCRQCEFDFTGSFAGGTSAMEIGAGGHPGPALNTFKIKIGYFEEENKYASGTHTIDNFTSDEIRNNKWSKKKLGASLDSMGSFLSGLPVVGDKVSSMAGKAASELQSILNTPNKLINQAASELQSMAEQGKLGQVNSFGYPTNDDIIPSSTATPK